MIKTNPSHRLRPVALSSWEENKKSVNNTLKPSDIQMAFSFLHHLSSLEAVGSKFPTTVKAHIHDETK